MARNNNTFFDRTFVMIAAGVIGTLVLAKVLSPHGGNSDTSRAGGKGHVAEAPATRGLKFPGAAAAIMANESLPTCSVDTRQEQVALKALTNTLAEKGRIKIHASDWSSTVPHSNPPIQGVSGYEGNTNIQVTLKEEHDSCHLYFLDPNSGNQESGSVPVTIPITPAS